MVVLEHDAVEKSHAVVPSSAAGYGVFFEVAEPGGGFSGVEESGGGIAEGGDVGLGCGGDAAETLKEVEEGAFC
mgnify:CR=1 FL=1